MEAENIFTDVKKALLSLFLLVIPLLRSEGAAISIDNYNFETGGLPNDGFTCFPGVIPMGWYAIDGSVSGAFFGYLNPDNYSYTGTTGNNVIGTMDGPNMFYFGSLTDGQGIFQSLSATFNPSTDYALTVASGARAGGYMASLEMQLFAGSTMIANQIVKNTTLDTVQDFTLNYFASSANNYLTGQNLSIRFLERNFDPSTDFEVDIDNVRLTATAVPEPSTYALFGIGAIGMLFSLRRKKTA